MAANLEIDRLFASIAGPHACGPHMGGMPRTCRPLPALYRSFAALRLDVSKLAALGKSGRSSAAKGPATEPRLAADQSEDLTF
jgi:hypothetical protein